MANYGFMSLFLLSISHFSHPRGRHHALCITRGNAMAIEEVLKIKEVAALLKVGEKTVYSMAQTGELPAFKVRGQWRFSRKDIDAWIEQQKNTTQDFGEDDQK